MAAKNQTAKSPQDRRGLLPFLPRRERRRRLHPAATAAFPERRRTTERRRYRTVAGASSQQCCNHHFAGGLLCHGPARFDALRHLSIPSHGESDLFEACLIVEN